MAWYTPLHILHALVHSTGYILCLCKHHYTPYCMPLYTPYIPWYTPHALVPTTTHFMPWYTPHALACTTIHLICTGTHHYASYIPWYTPLHTYALLNSYSLVHTLHALVHTTTHPLCLGTYHYTPNMCSIHTTCFGTHHYTPCMLILDSLFFTTMHLICLGISLYTLYNLVHTTTLVKCLDCAERNSTLHHAQLHPKKDELCL